MFYNSRRCFETRICA